jgi:hypothetical protein
MLCSLFRPVGTAETMVAHVDRPYGTCRHKSWQILSPAVNCWAIVTGPYGTEMWTATRANSPRLLFRV